MSVAGLGLGSNVLDLTDYNFQDTIGKHDNLMVEFYAPWCGYFRHLVYLLVKINENFIMV